MAKPAGMSSREYYHYKRLNNPKRYEPLARACKFSTDFQGKNPKRIIDLGSSCGALLKELEIVYGTEDTFGVDVSEFAEKHWCSSGTFIRSNLNELDMNIVDRAGKLDLILSFEVAEHLERIEQLFALTALLSQKNATMIFGAASPMQESSKGHVNCQWPSWWMSFFQKNGEWKYDHLATTRFAYFIGNENSKGMDVPMYYLNALVFRRDELKG